jgi:hypothetical protein
MSRHRDEIAEMRPPQMDRESSLLSVHLLAG